MDLLSRRRYCIDFSNERNSSIDYLLGMLKDTRTTTLLTVQNYTVAELDWQYDEGWNTIGALLLHIAAIEEYFRIVYIELRELSERENGDLTPALDLGVHVPSLINGREINYYIHELTLSRKNLLKSLQHVKLEDFIKTFDSREYGGECNLAWLLYHMMEDEIYHRGQISMIKKLRQVGNKK